MAEIVYVLCALTSLLCAGLLVRHYRIQRTRLLLWSTVGFVGLALNNAVLFVDIVVVPELDLAMVRTLTALVAMTMLVVGLVWESR